MTASVTIETTADAALLASIHRAGFDEPWSEAFFASLLSQAGVTAWIAASPQPVGFILMRAVAEMAEILTLAVRPENRGQGIGRALVERALAEVKALNAQKCFLEVAKDNTAAVALYRACGFALCGERPRYYARGTDMIDALVMERKLT
ncbi:MAG: ribosomal protein S18-alanine N-acetyltransferase [Rhodospirillaceae bacterium]|nr:ribosomal protein S18-alanine N-acetyltransferase [Rhodospirillaceae bacterium]